MNLTIGFILLFLILFLPGIIFRRFYYLGEFSKQISPEESIFKTLTYSIIPSAIIQIAGIIFYSKFISDIDFIALINFYKELLNTTKLSPDSKFLLNEKSILNLLVYQIAIYGASIVSALLGYLSVRFFGLDKRIKLLRFKNQWAYVFNAEILLFGKFKKRKLSPNNKFLFSYLDVMVRKNEKETELYSGVLTDYELNPKNISEIDRIYLDEAKRYKQKDGKYISKRIPGEFLILLGKEILNINVNYLVDENRKDKNKLKKQNFLFTYNIVLLSVTILSLPIIIFNIVKIDFYYQNQLFQLSWWMRFGVWICLNLSYSFLFPFEKASKDRNYFEFIGWKELLKRFVLSIILISIIFGVIYIFI